MPVPPAVLVRAAADVTVVEVDGRVGVHDVAAGRVVALSAAAAEVFALCDGTAGEAEIAGLLAAAYREDGDTTARAVAGAVRELVAAGLVRRVAASATP